VLGVIDRLTSQCFGCSAFSCGMRGGVAVVGVTEVSAMISYNKIGHHMPKSIHSVRAYSHDIREY